MKAEPENEPACQGLQDFYGLSIAGRSGSGQGGVFRTSNRIGRFRYITSRAER